MAASPPSPPASGWVADPVRDFTCYRLIDLAVAALDVAFADGHVELAYRRWLAGAGRKPGGRRAAARGGAAGEAEGRLELNSWRRPGGHGVRVLALPRQGEFAVVIEEEHFSAEVLAVYDPDSQGLIAAGIERFTGDPGEAIRLAAQFVEMLDETEGEGDPDSASMALAPDSVAARVAEIADRQAAAMGRPGGGLGPEDERFLMTTPEALWAIRDGFVERVSPPRRSSPATMLAWQTLLERQLEELRFKIERRHGWAIALVDRYQDDLLVMARRPGVDINAWQALVIALDRAKIAIKPEVRMASMDLASGEAAPAPAVADIVHSLEEIVESGGGDPFRIATRLFDAMTMMPPDFSNVAVRMVSEAPLPALRDVLPLILLAPEEACRRAAAAALEQMASDRRLTPAGLRRLITLRGWLPDAERPVVDQAVRRARLARIDCAPWPEGQIRSLLATVIDGSGCQSLLALAKDGPRHLFAGILTKQGFGVRDVLSQRNLPRREGEEMLAEVGSRLLSRVVARSYLDRMVQHALATGVAARRMPPLALLEVAEVLGAAEWRAEALDTPAELGRLLACVPPELATPEAVAATLRRSGGWTALLDLAGSWFEDDETARALCARHRRAPKKAVTALLETVLEPRRTVWAERLVWMALWSEGGSLRADLPRWHDYAQVAKALYDGRPLAEVPLMAEIARATLARAE